MKVIDSKSFGKWTINGCGSTRGFLYEEGFLQVEKIVISDIMSNVAKHQTIQLYRKKKNNNNKFHVNYYSLQLPCERLVKGIIRRS